MMAVMNGQHLLHPFFFESDAAFLKAYMTTLETNEESVLHRLIHEERIYLLGAVLKNPNIDVNVRNLIHDPPLMAALKMRNNDMSLLFLEKILQHKNTDISLSDYDGETPLHEIARKTTPTADKMLDLILKHPKCDVNIKNYLGESPLHVAKTISIAKKLLENGADVNFKDNSNNIALHKQVDNSTICQMLIEKGSLINVQNLKGLTPLHEAASCNQMETVKLLLKNGASVNIETCYTERHTPLYTAYSCYASEALKEVLWPKSKLMYLMFAGNFESAKIPQILEKWSSAIKGEQETVKFTISLINLVKNAKHINEVSCGRIVAQFFLDNVELLSQHSCQRLFKKFRGLFKRSVLNFLLKTHDYSRVDSNKEIETMIELLLEKGEVLDYSDFEVIYLQFGDCDLLHKLLKEKVVPKSRKLKDILLFPRTLLSLTTNLSQLIRRENGNSLNVFDFYDVHNLARYCTFSKSMAEDFKTSYHNIVKYHKPDIQSEQLEKDIEEIKKNSGVPSLLELSRDAVRPALCRNFRMGRAHELYSVLKEIGVPPLLIGVIMFELPIHYNVSKPSYVPYYHMAYSL